LKTHRFGTLCHSKSLRTFYFISYATLARREGGGLEQRASHDLRQPCQTWFDSPSINLESLWGNIFSNNKRMIRVYGSTQEISRNCWKHENSCWANLCRLTFSRFFKKFRKKLINDFRFTYLQKCFFCYFEKKPS